MGSFAWKTWDCIARASCYASRNGCCCCSNTNNNKVFYVLLHGLCDAVTIERSLAALGLCPNVSLACVVGR